MWPELMYLISAYLFTIAAIGTVLCQGRGEVYNITRNSHFLDVFKVPASNCTKDGEECMAYNNAYPDGAGPCTCSCPDNAGTFGFFSGSWTCLDNAEMRRQAACKLRLDAEIDQYPLTTLEDATYYYLLLSSESCSLNLEESLYFDCGGKWKKLGWKISSGFVNTFTKHSSPPAHRLWEYSFTVKLSKPVAGQIISLHFNCTNPSQSSCLPFKTIGQITCPVVISSTPNPISVTTTKSPGHRNQTQHGSQSGSLSSSPPPPPSSSPPSSSSSSSSSPGTIAAGVIIVTFVIILAAIIGFVVWKKKKGENVLLMDKMLAIVKNTRSPSTTVTVEDADEEVYTEIPDELAQRQRGTRTEMLVRSAGINTYAFEVPHPQPIYALPENRYASLVRNSMIQEKTQEEPLADDDGYLEPRQLPIYVEFEGAEGQVAAVGSTEDSTANTDEGPYQTEQQSSNGSGEGSGVTTVVYACVNKKRNLPRLPTGQSNGDDTGGEEETASTANVF